MVAKGGILSQKTIVQKTFLYTVCGLINGLMSFASTILLRSWIPPAQFGLWNMTQVIVGFVNKFTIGIDAGILRELPLERGRNNQNEIQSLQVTALVLSVLQGLVFAFLMLLCFFLMRPQGDFGTSLIWIMASVIIVFDPLVTSTGSILMAHGHFDRAGYLSVLTNFVSQATRFGGGFVAGPTGLIVGGALASPLNFGITTLFKRLVNIRFGLQYISIHAAKRLLRYSISLRIFDYPSNLFLTIDSLAVAALFGSESIALYATATAVLNFIEIPVTYLTSPIRNEWRTRFGKNPEDVSIAKGSFDMLNYQALFIWPLVAVFSYYVVQIIMVFLLPKYAGALPVLKILLIVWVFTPQSYSIRDLLALRGNFRILCITGSSGLAVFFITVSLLRTVFGLDGMEMIAFSFLISCMVYMSTLLVTIGREMWGGRRTLLAAGILLASGVSIWISLGLATLPVGLDFREDFFCFIKIVGYSILPLLPILGVGIYSSLPILKLLYNSLNRNNRFNRLYR